MVATGLFNYYTSFVMEPGSEVTYEVYALESTSPRCEGYYLQWDISTSPYSISFEVNETRFVSLQFYSMLFVERNFRRAIQFTNDLLEENSFRFN